MKVSGSYSSVVRGVSEQVPQDRRPGQHYEQVNMISDPVRGLARRHGSLNEDEKVLGNYVSATHALWLDDTARHKVFTFFVDGVEYDIIYRSRVDSNSLGSTTFAWAMNKDTGKYIPVSLAADTGVLVTGGVSAIVNVGKYIFLGGNNIVPGYVGTDRWDDPVNRKHLAVWIRSGAYSRTFKVTLTKTDNTKISVSYKTKASSYPTLLDTSGISASASDYQKQVNDMVYAYNSAVTKWIGDAAADITPENIAQKLVDALTAAGIASCTRVGATVCVDDPLYKEVEAEDDGDGSMVRAVGAEVANIDLVSNTHYAGKIVKIRPKKNNQDDTLYLKAVSKEGTTGFTEVTWRECAGYEMLPTAPFAIGTVKSGTLYIGGTPASLAALSGDPVPDFRVNEVGDDITSPLPYFIDKKVDYLGLFQDRLVIGSGAVLFFSKPGDYFNWFKGSVLTVQDNDPIEMYALGSEDDTIKASTTYDRNMMLFGKRKQYTVNGRQPLTPRSASIVVLSSHEDAVDADPQNSGNFVFYTKARNGVSSVHQVQMGVLADNPESFNISQQLDRYILGKPVEILAVTAPNCIFVRTDASRQALYTYSYLDTATGDQRLFDSWSRWEWDAQLGDMVGVSRRRNGDVLVHMLRHGFDKDGTHKVWIACDSFVLDTSIAPRPYIDSARMTMNVLTPTSSSFIQTASDLDNVFIAYGDEGGTKKFLGTDMAHLTSFVTQYPDAGAATWAGIAFDSYVSPTNPYMRDQQGKVIVVGRLTIGRFNISLADTGGMQVSVDTTNGSKLAQDFSGRLLGRASNLIGQQPLVSTSVTAAVGRETREFTYTIKAKTFLPLTITAIEWVGQYFNNARRV